MTLHETVYLLVLITVISCGMLVARLWSVGIGLAIAAAPIVLISAVGVVCAAVERHVARNRIPRAQALARRRAS